MKLILTLSFIFGFALAAMSQTVSVPNDGNIYLNPDMGKDENTGKKENPLKSLI